MEEQMLYIWIIHMNVVPLHFIKNEYTWTTDVVNVFCFHNQLVMDIAGLAVPVRLCRDAFAPGVGFLVDLGSKLVNKAT